MRNGYKIIDTDTHVGPTADILYEYGSAELLARRSELAPYEREFRDGIGLSINPFPYKRKMGESAFVEEAEKGGAPALKGAVGSNRVEDPEVDVQQKNSVGRLRDMDREGRDIDLIIPGTFATAITAIDESLARELYASYLRYIVDYCSPDPTRLKATLPLPASDPEWSAAQIRRLSGETCVAAVTVVLPEGLPVDDPSLHPIWSAMGDADLPLLHHSFFYEPPYFPGYRDVWGQVAMARAAAHPWGAQRLLGYVILSGLLDQYPRLRIGFAECSGGWLPSWIVRLEGQASYLARTLPTLLRSPRGYVEDGRVFCGVELYEGEETIHSIMAVLGDDAIMYSSDYPHDQCAFPKSPDTILGWQSLGSGTLTKLFSGNAERYLRML